MKCFSVRPSLMSKLFSSKHIIKILLKHGFILVGQKGSHKKFKKDEFTVIIPDPRKEIPIGTFYSILRQSGLKKENFHWAAAVMNCELVSFYDKNYLQCREYFPKAVCFRIITAWNKTKYWWYFTVKIREITPIRILSIGTPGEAQTF